MPSPQRRLYHLALQHEWHAAARRGGAYRRSTLGRSLDDVGFVHCSFADQVQGIADLLYRGRTDVVLLAIDPDRLTAEVRVEDLEGSGRRFPHVYGPIELAAVVAATPIATSPDGRLLLDGLDDGPWDGALPPR